MTRKNTTLVKYPTGVFEDDEKTGILLPEYHSKRITHNFTKRYHNCLYLICGIRGCARDLLDFLIDRMDYENIVYNSKYIRDEFRKGIEENCDIKYSDIAVAKSYSLLQHKGFIISKGRGVFKVNPEYFWKADEDSRLKTIKIELEFTKNQDTIITINKK